MRHPWEGLCLMLMGLYGISIFIFIVYLIYRLNVANNKTVYPNTTCSLKCGMSIRIQCLGRYKYQLYATGWVPNNPNKPS